ncbi:MAG: hypothetical protein ACP5N2_00670 [Candidatus Nanoarchaeia archaeon]
MKNKLFAVLIMIFLLAGFVLAESDSFKLDTEHSENLYLTNNEVSIESKLYGDLYSISERIDVNGLVRDDINAMTGVFDFRGTVGSDVRLVSSSAVIDGVIFGEFINFGNYVKITNKAVIGGPVNINANIVVIDGTIQDDLYVKAEKVILNGVVEGNAVIKAAKFELGPDAKIMGDLSSTRNVEDFSSQVEGTITKIKGRDDPTNFTAITLSKLGLFIMIFLIGTVMILVTKKRTERTTKTMYTKFLFSMLIGFIALALAPFVALMLLFTIVGIPIALLIVAIYVLVLILTLGFVALFLGRLNIKMAKSKNNLWLELLIGSLALALISIIPVIFWLVVILLGFVGAGAMILVYLGKDKKK